MLVSHLWMRAHSCSVIHIWNTVSCKSSLEPIHLRLNEIRGAMGTLRNGKLPLVKFDKGGAYEGEWLNGNLHGRGIMTYVSRNR